MEEKHHQSTLRGPGIKYTCDTSSMLHKPYTSPFIHHLVRQRQLHSYSYAQSCPASILTMTSGRLVSFKCFEVLINLLRTVASLSFHSGSMAWGS